MIIPDHWAEARQQHRAAGRQITVRRFGWSAVSADDAGAMAARRADEALRLLIGGQQLLRREPKVPYNGAAGVPIREEVLARHGDAVITRNAYGAQCLNSPNALFADVDFDTPLPFKPIAAVFAVLALLSAAIGASHRSWVVGLALLFASLALAGPFARLLRRVGAAAQGGAQAGIFRRLKAFLSTRPDWNVRVYKTPAGLRLLATHRPFHPSDPEVESFFRAVMADPVYVRMCLNQQCFRARLTAKPWRIGIAAHMRPRPGVWPVAPEQMGKRNAWIVAYEARAQQFAACRYLASIGSGAVHQQLQPVIDLHDSACRANAGNTALA
jgi:hypothetical protein